MGGGACMMRGSVISEYINRWEKHVSARAGFHGNPSVGFAVFSPTAPTPPPPSLHRNEWDPPDKKVDTRKYRAEPRSIFEYEPGKSSVLKLERTVS